MLGITTLEIVSSCPASHWIKQDDCFCISVSVKWMSLWLGQRLSKDYLPPEENLQPTKRGRCSDWGSHQCPPALCLVRKAHPRSYEPVSWTPAVPMVRARDGWPLVCRVCSAKFRAALSSIARMASCQVAWFRQHREWGCEAAVSLPQHPIRPLCPQLCHRAVYGNKLIWSLPTIGLQCGFPSIFKS